MKRQDRIESELRGLTAWLDEFVADVMDYNGASMISDLREFIASAQAALAEEKPFSPEDLTVTLEQPTPQREPLVKLLALEVKLREALSEAVQQRDALQIEVEDLLRSRGNA